MATNICKPHEKRGGADRGSGSSDEEEKKGHSIRVPLVREATLVSEFITEGHGVVKLHDTKKAAAEATLISPSTLNTLIRRAQAAGVRVTDRCATGFRFAVPTYMERLMIVNIKDKRPQQLMLEAFFLPENIRVPEIMPPPAALALMSPEFLKYVKGVMEKNLYPGLLRGGWCSPQPCVGRQSLKMSLQQRDPLRPSQTMLPRPTRWPGPRTSTASPVKISHLHAPTMSHLHALKTWTRY